jgi:hypothetical protein
MMAWQDIYGTIEDFIPSREEGWTETGHSRTLRGKVSAIRFWINTDEQGEGHIEIHSEREDKKGPQKISGVIRIPEGWDVKVVRGLGEVI